MCLFYNIAIFYDSCSDLSSLLILIPKTEFVSSFAFVLCFSFPSADWTLLDCFIDRKVRDIIFGANFSPLERYQNIQDNLEYNSVLPLHFPKTHSEAICGILFSETIDCQSFLKTRQIHERYSTWWKRADQKTRKKQTVCRLEKMNVIDDFGAARHLWRHLPTGIKAVFFRVSYNSRLIFKPLFNFPVFSFCSVVAS